MLFYVCKAYENNNFSKLKTILSTDMLLKTATQIFARPISKYLLYNFSDPIQNIEPLKNTLKGYC